MRLLIDISVVWVAQCVAVNQPEHNGGIFYFIENEKKRWYWDEKWFRWINKSRLENCSYIFFSRCLLFTKYFLFTLVNPLTILPLFVTWTHTSPIIHFTFPLKLVIKISQTYGCDTKLVLNVMLKVIDAIRCDMFNFFSQNLT